MTALGRDPLRVTEEDLYECICNMRVQACGATSAQHLIEALFFLDGLTKFQFVNLTEVVSPRCKGAARDLFLGKRLLTQKRPLSAYQLQSLEALMQTLPHVEVVILGQLLFCAHACARWSDSQRISEMWLETGKVESLLRAEAIGSKTTLTADAQRRLLPYVALGSGLSQVPWAQAWIDARKAQMMEESEFFFPSFLEKIGNWAEAPMSAADGTVWLRSFLDMIGADCSLIEFGAQIFGLKWNRVRTRLTQTRSQASPQRLTFPSQDEGEILAVEPPFDTFPAERLIIHKSSKVVHVLNEDLPMWEKSFTLVRTLDGFQCWIIFGYGLLPAMCTCGQTHWGERRLVLSVLSPN